MTDFLPDLSAGLPKTIEILAPAGSMEALTAAVRSGASAVYLGGSSFSARANAQNFDNAQLKLAVEYCHARDVKVYLAVNTVLQQEELTRALNFIEFACSLPVDALIVQDLGLVWMLRRCAPELKLNASTQMAVHTPAGVRVLAENGFTRVVLARELSLDEIREIKEKNIEYPIELESFVHGALCMSVSGQCYFSSVLGSRSGNRGLCAQPCRLPFSVPGGTGNDLSLKDLSLIARMEELVQAGVASAKIEGRMKRPEYVAAATAACRFASDGKIIPTQLLQNLFAVFSRSGFTMGYPDGKRGRDMFGARSKLDVTNATSEVFSELQKLYQKEPPRIQVNFDLTIKSGEPVRLKAVDPQQNCSEVISNIFPETALNRPIDTERCENQLKKTGGTLFYSGIIQCRIENGLSIPVSALNGLRREVLEQLEQMRQQRPQIAFQCVDMPTGVHTPPKNISFRARFTNVENIPEAAKQCELIYLPLSVKTEQFIALQEQGFPVAAELPRGMFGTEQSVEKKLKKLISQGIRDCRAGNLGAAALAVKLGMRVHGSFSLNITNTPAVLWYQDLGLCDTELSFELTLNQAAKIGGDFPHGLVLYGRLPLMLCRNCPAANSVKGCLNCQTAPDLTDRKGIKFPIQCEGGCSEILNSVPLYLADRLDEVKGQDFGVLLFTVENSVESGEIIRQYLSPVKGEKPPETFTRGLFYRGIE